MAASTVATTTIDEITAKFGDVASRALLFTPPATGTTSVHSAIVDSKLFHSSSTAYTGTFLADNKITAAVNMAGSEVVSLPRSDLADAGIALHECEVDDSTKWADENDCAAVLSKAASVIEDAIVGDGAVLVNCAMGRSRSSFAVLWWILAYDRPEWGYLDALAYLRSKRTFAYPNMGFSRALVALAALPGPIRRTITTDSALRGAKSDTTGSEPASDTEGSHRSTPLTGPNPRETEFQGIDLSSPADLELLHVQGDKFLRRTEQAAESIVSITGCTIAQAIELFEKHGGDIDAAVGAMFDSG